MTNALRISPSKLTTFLSCHRKYWFQSIHKLPDRTDSSKRNFGTVLHSVIELWNSADDLGRDKAGNPIDPFAEGWDKTLRYGEADEAKRLFQAAVDAGILVRRQNRVFEEPYQFEVMPGIEMHGIMDVYVPGGTIEDFKTTSARKWALSAAKLARDPKSLCYAVEALRRQPDLKEVRLILTYFCRDPGERTPVWGVEVPVPAEAIRKFEQETLLPSAQEMLRISKIGPVDAWLQIEGPQEHDACKKYGGCPFAEICAGMTTPRRLSGGILPIMTTTNPAPTVPGKRPSRLGAMLAPAAPSEAPPAATEAPPAATEAPPAATEAPPAAPAQPAPTPAPGPEVAPQAAPETRTAPWAVTGCVPCKGTGINSKQQPCRACDAVAARKGLPTSASYTLGKDGAGNLTWSERVGACIMPTPGSPGAVAAAQAAAPPSAEPAAVAPAPAAPPPSAEPAPATPPAGTPPAEPAAPKRPRGRPRKGVLAQPAPEATLQVVSVAAAPDQVAAVIDVAKQDEKILDLVVQANRLPGYLGLGSSFMLLINAVPLGTADSVDLSEVLAKEGAELAKARGAESYYLLDTWQRRDAIASKAAEIAKGLAGKVVYTISPSPDVKALLDALRSHASLVAIGMVGAF